jgi:hypothetical protein
MDRMKGIKPYFYPRFTWFKGIDVDNESKRLSAEFDVKPINTPDPSPYELTLHKATRKEIIIKADTLGVIIGAFKAVLYQRESAPFTAKDLKLRKEIFELYPRRSTSPLPIGYGSEPRFVTEEPNVEICTREKT